MFVAIISKIINKKKRLLLHHNHHLTMCVQHANYNSTRFKYLISNNHKKIQQVVYFGRF